MSEGRQLRTRECASVSSEAVDRFRGKVCGWWCFVLQKLVMKPENLIPEKMLASLLGQAQCRPLQSDPKVACSDAQRSRDLNIPLETRPCDSGRVGWVVGGGDIV